MQAVDIPAYRIDEVNGWLDRVFTHAPGCVSVAYADQEGIFHATDLVFKDWACAAEKIDDLAAEGATGIYVRCTTLMETPPPGRRGGAADSMALPMLWSDIDFGTVGHASPRDGRLPLPPDETPPGRS
jgi:hypothetical protein